jgi:hypothetical protein
MKIDVLPFGRKQSVGTSDGSRPDKPVDAAWIVLEAANDLGDEATIQVCRRVIDASLNGKPAAAYDLHVVSEYFR